MRPSRYFTCSFAFSLSLRYNSHLIIVYYTNFVSQSYNVREHAAPLQAVSKKTMMPVKDSLPENIQQPIPQSGPPKKVFIKTFGCQMNEYDSSRMADLLHA